MSRRGVALNTSLIHINNMSAYYNTNQINIYNSIDITGNTSISHNLSVKGTDDITHNTNIVNNEITHIVNLVQSGSGSSKLISIDNNQVLSLDLYIGNTYIFDQSNSIGNSNDRLIISKRTLQYNRTNYNIIRDEYTTGVSYFYSDTFNLSDDLNRYKLKFTPTQRGVYYLVSKALNSPIRAITINILDNIYKYGSLITNSGFGLLKNLNVGGNMNVKDGMLYIVNDPQYTQPKAVGVGTTIPRLGLDMTNLPNYNDAVILPRSIGLGDQTGVEGMVRMNGELSVAEGYLEDEWVALGLVQDKDKDTFIDPEISVEREDEMEFTTNGHKRFTILSTDNTQIGIATTLPKSTLEINGNLNVSPDIGSSGVDFCNDITHGDNYLHVNLTNTNTILDRSFDFKANNGGLFKEISADLIESISSKTRIQNNYNYQLNIDYNFVNHDISTIQINSNTDVTISKKLNKTFENSAIETHKTTDQNIIHGISENTYRSSFNINIDGNHVNNIYKTKYLNIIDNVVENYNSSYNTNIALDLTETVTGARNKTVTDFNFETYRKDLTHNVFLTKTSFIKNNYNTLINTIYDIDIKGNTTEIYNNNSDRKTTSFRTLNIHGSNKSHANNSNYTYKHNVNINNVGYLERKITINKNNNILGNFTQTYKNNVVQHTSDDNFLKLYGVNMFNLNNNYYYNVSINKNINIEHNLSVTTHGNRRHYFEGSITNNIFYNTNYYQNFTHNMNKISNLVVYNGNDKFINLNSVEVFKKNKFNYLWLSGHPLSGPNTISYEIPNVYLTNYIKIVTVTDYNINVANNSTYYTFPGIESKKANQDRSILLDWVIFIPKISGSAANNSYAIIDSYYSNISSSQLNQNSFYRILGPTDQNNFAIVQDSANFDENGTYDYKYKFIMGPRKHQLDYNLTTHYIKIFNIGLRTTCISLLKLTEDTSIVTQFKTSSDLTSVSSITDVGTTNTNEFSRFIFIYNEEVQKEVNNNGTIVKSSYYIYSKSEDYIVQNQGEEEGEEGEEGEFTKSFYASKLFFR